MANRNADDIAQRSATTPAADFSVQSSINLFVQRADRGICSSLTSSLTLLTV
jgi:hypothetical protein